MIKDHGWRSNVLLSGTWMFVDENTFIFLKRIGVKVYNNPTSISDMVHFLPIYVNRGQERPKTTRTKLLFWRRCVFFFRRGTCRDSNWGAIIVASYVCLVDLRFEETFFFLAPECLPTYRLVIMAKRMDGTFDTTTSLPRPKGATTMDTWRVLRETLHDPCDRINGASIN